MRTNRITFLVNDVEKAQLTLETDAFHGSRSGLIRYKLFAERVQQYTPQTTLNRPPLPPVKMDATRGNMVHVIIELKEKLAERKKIVDNYEEELLKEVEIK